MVLFAFLLPDINDLTSPDNLVKAMVKLTGSILISLKQKNLNNRC